MGGDGRAHVDYLRSLELSALKLESAIDANAVVNPSVLIEVTSKSKEDWLALGTPREYGRARSVTCRVA